MDTHMNNDKVPPELNLATITRPSSSNIFETGRLGLCERSPIRTLSEDRVHVSLRLGPIVSDSESGNSDLHHHSDLPALSKAEGKKKMTKAQGKKRSAHTPPKAANAKKRRVTKPPTPPRRKLLLDAITAGGRGLSGVSRGTPKRPKIVPPVTKKGKDFQSPHASLP